jgi:hypothetical protein
LKTILKKGDPVARPAFMANDPYGVLDPWPDSWTQEVEHFQVHYARDLVISDPDFNLSMLQDVKPKYSKATVVYRNSGVVETVSHHSSKNVAKHSIYDKFIERNKLLMSKKRHKDSFAPVDPGTKRYEVQIPRAELKKFNNTTLDILTEERVLKAINHYWELSNYGGILKLF